MSQDDLLTLNSYSSLSNFSLPIQCDLHPQACCPTMDIVALVSTSADGASAVNLYRLAGGPKAWSVDVKGPVGAMGWSFDGLHLAVFLPSPSELVILSVHDGAIIQTVAVPGGQAQINRDCLATLWAEHKIEWEPVDVRRIGGAVGKGKGKASIQAISSVFEMLNLLPLVTPMDTPPPTNSAATSFFPLSFPKPAAPSSTSTAPTSSILLPPLPHLLHSTLPSHSSPSTALPPTLLTLSSCLAFLSGSFPLAPVSPRPLLSQPCSNRSELAPPLLDYARTLTALQTLLHDAISAISVLSSEWFGKDGGGMMTRDWMKSLKEVGARFEGGEVDVREEFTRLLITGKGGDAVAHFMGGRLTERTLSRWEGTVLAALTSIRQACYRHVTPGFEHVVLLLEEMYGWSLWEDQYSQFSRSSSSSSSSSASSSQLSLDASDLKRAVDLARHAVVRSCELESAAREEHRRFGQFTNWLRYELSIATSPDPHSVEPSTPPATHDVLLVADYIQTGLISSPVDIFLRPYSPSEDHAHASVIAIPASPLEIPRNVDLSRAISRTLAPLQAGGKLKDYEEGADLEVPSTDPNGSTASTIYNKSRHGLKADGRRRSSVGGSGKGMVSPVLGRRTLAAKRKQTRLSQSFGGEGEKSSMMSISMSVSMDESSRMDSSLGGLVQEQSGEKEEGCSLTDIGGELMRVLRRITERALAGEMDPQRALAQGRKRRRVDGVKGRIRDRIVRTDAIGSSAWVAFVAVTPHGPLLYIASSGTSTEFASTLNGWRCSLQLDLSPRPTAVKLLDMDFFTDDELVLVLGVGEGEESKVLLASISYNALQFRPIPVPSNSDSRAPIEMVLQHLEPLEPYLPLSRCRHLSSLDRMPFTSPAADDNDEGSACLSPISLALNGRKGRMTGSLLTWGGREVEVFDLADDEGAEEDEEEGESMVE